MFRDSWPKIHPLEPRTPRLPYYVSTPPPPPGRYIGVLWHRPAKSVLLFHYRRLGVCWQCKKQHKQRNKQTKHGQHIARMITLAFFLGGGGGWGGGGSGSAYESSWNNLFFPFSSPFWFPLSLFLRSLSMFMCLVISLQDYWHFPPYAVELQKIIYIMVVWSRVDWQQTLLSG